MSTKLNDDIETDQEAVDQESTNIQAEGKGFCFRYIKRPLDLALSIISLRKYTVILKRCIDFISSLLGLIILSPLFLAIALLIKFSSKGSVFFKQERVGYKQNIFKILKFRTMVINAEQSGDGLFIFGDKDNRITRVGKILRQTSLDELPQLINVLLGDMSLVGPRPPVTYHPYKVNEYPEWAVKRFNVKPGITGLAQIRTRTTAPWDKRIEIDNEYVDKCSVIFDFKILFKTFILVIKKSKIYPESKEQLIPKNEEQHEMVIK